MPILPFGRKQTPIPLPTAVGRGEAAYGAIYQRLHPAGRAFAAKLVGTLWAEDVLQDTFLGLWDICYKEGEPPKEEVDDLFFRILRRRIADFVRSESTADKRNRAYVLDLKARLGNQQETARVAETSLLSGRLEYLTAALPPQMRRAHELREAGREYPEIAAALQTSEATARWNVHEAKQRLKRQLVRDGYEGEPR